MERDLRCKQILEAEGWNVLVLWECEIKGDFDRLMRKLTTELLHNIHTG